MVGMSRLVLPIDGKHRVLVVTDVPSNEDGDDLGAHASQRNLGAYWFTRQDGRWVPRPGVIRCCGAASREVSAFRRRSMDGVYKPVSGRDPTHRL
jgi:hypothetical protein